MLHLVVVDLLSSLRFHYPPGPEWRALVPIVALVWLLVFAASIPLALKRLATWSDPALRNAAVLSWGALLPSFVLSAEYVVRVLIRATGSGWSILTLAPIFLANLVVPIPAFLSFYVRRAGKGPASFEIVRGLYAAAWAVSWGLWWRSFWIAFESA